MIRKFIKKVSTTAGLPPGTVVPISEKTTEAVRLTLMDYDEGQFQFKEIREIEECFPFRDTSSVTWVNIDGVHRADIVEKVGKHFNIHPLVLEDIADTGQRPKFEDLGEHLFVVLKMLTCGNGTDAGIDAEQVSLIIGNNFVISFQEKPGDVFDPIRDRIRTGKGRVRKMGADFLGYALMDAIVDNYFGIFEKIADDMEKAEEALLENSDGTTLETVYHLKKELMFLRKAIWPLRDVVSGMERCGSTLVKKTTLMYLRDLYDHTIQVIDTTETFRDMTTGMLDLYLSHASNRLNEVMKTLTIFASIFIPLTFVAGVYGMNFKYMPELEWRWGYFAVLGFMLTAGTAMLIYYRRKKWL